MRRTRCIGVFDSGFGGLDVMRGIVKQLPKYDYVFLGDSARAPYGSRSKKEIYRFSQQAAGFLFARGCDLVIFACNTASSDALYDIQHSYLPERFPDKKVLGVLIPFSEEAVRQTKNHRIGIIATTHTVRTRKFVRELTKLDSRVRVFQNPSPRLVPLVEGGEVRSVKTVRAIRVYVRPLLNKKIDTLILGCTHYGLLRRAVQNTVGRGIEVISETNVVPPRLVDYLKRHRDIEKRLTQRGTRQFFTTGDIKHFSKLGSRFYGKKIIAKKATLS